MIVADWEVAGSPLQAALPADFFPDQIVVVNIPSGSSGLSPDDARMRL